MGTGMNSRDEIKKLSKTPVKPQAPNKDVLQFQVPLRIENPDNGIADGMEALTKWLAATNKEISGAIRSVKLPESHDYTRMLYAISKALTELELKSENNVNVDVSALVSAVEANTRIVESLIETMSRPKTVVYDGDKIVGVELDNG